MNKELREAEAWLNRNYNQLKKLDADKRTLEIFGNRLGTGVGRYENDGTQNRDATISQARHEDALIDYSAQREKVERQLEKLAPDLAKTRRAIEELEDGEQAAIAIDRYINRLRWKDIALIQHVSESQLFRIRIHMLEKMAAILRSGKYD